MDLVSRLRTILEKHRHCCRKAGREIGREVSGMGLSARKNIGDGSASNEGGRGLGEYLMEMKDSGR